MKRIILSCIVSLFAHVCANDAHESKLLAAIEKNNFNVVYEVLCALKQQEIKFSADFKKIIFEKSKELLKKEAEQTSFRKDAFLRFTDFFFKTCHFFYAAWSISVLFDIYKSRSGTRNIINHSALASLQTIAISAQIPHILLYLCRLAIEAQNKNFTDIEFLKAVGIRYLIEKFDEENS